VVSDLIPNSEDVPALVALLSEQIADVKTSIDDLKKGLSAGLNHLEIRLDDHAGRLTALERSEIRREEAERVKAQFFETVGDAQERDMQRNHVLLSKTQIRIGWAGVLVACSTIVLSEIHQLLT
jgi:hypothetical protein